jgi:GNAT superfamily N-acetyltransferase
MKIRYGNFDDANLLAELGAKTFTDSFAADNTPENTALYIERSFSPEIQHAQLSDPNVVFLIAEVDDQTVGYAKLNLNRDHESQENPKTMELERIYSIKELIGKGVGSELMQACIDEARQQGCDSLWLGVWEKNPRAIAFYKKWGFKEIGTHTFMLGNDPQRDFVMELRLEQL